MSVKVEGNRRSVEIELEVEGTPEQAWQAIATGEGISAWCMPAVLEQAEGRPVALKMSFGPGMEATSRVTVYDAPRLFALESDSWIPGSPPIAAEWHVEAKAGGMCKIRIVQSLFASTDEWDGQIEALEGGWSAFLATLKIYLRHFAGQRSSLQKFMGPTEGREAQVWSKLIAALQLPGAGQRWTAPEGAPAAAGVVEYRSEGPYDALVRLDTPGPGIAAFGTVNMGGPTMLGMNLYFYGDAGAANAAREQPRWEAWMQQRFPMPSEALAGD